MSFLLKHFVLLHVFFLAAFLAWVHGGTRTDHLTWAPWLALLVVEWMFVMPPVRRGETPSGARRRVLRAVLRDPFFYVALALTSLLFAQFLHPIGDAAVDAPGGPARILKWHPFSVDPVESWAQICWFTPVLAAVLAVRHAVTRPGKRLLLELLAWNGALLSVFGFIQNLSGAHALYWITPLGSYFFSTFGYPNIAGAFFTLSFAVSAGLWLQRGTGSGGDPREYRLLAPMLLNGAGAIGSLSRAAILLMALLLLAGVGYAFWSAWRRLGAAGRVRALALGLLAVTAGGALLWSVPGSPLRREMGDIPVSFDRFYGDTIGGRLYQYRSAWDLAKDYPLFGTGGWGYRHFVHFYVTPERMSNMMSGKGTANVHNDILQFLCEHGSVGLGLMLALVGLLLAPIVRGSAWLIRQPETGLAWEEVGQSPLLRVPPIIVGILAGTAATVTHSIIDLPFRSPAVTILWALALACAPGFLPRKRTD